MERYNSSSFDAMHATIAIEERVIVSSDSIYDKIGLKRIKLEER